MGMERKDLQKEKIPMNRSVTSFALGAFLSAGLALAGQTPAAQDPAPAPGNTQTPAENSQAGGHRHADPTRQVRMLTKRLSLSSQQQDQLLPILKDREDQVRNVMNDASLSKKDQHAKMQTIREDSKTKIEALLTDSQKQQYQQMEQQMHDRMQQRRQKNQNSGVQN
jgi:protein CpxP